MFDPLRFLLKGYFIYIRTIMTRALLTVFCVLVLVDAYSQQKKHRKEIVKEDTVSLSVFLKKISSQITTDKIEKVNPGMELKTLTLYYDPKSNVSIVKSDLPKHNR
jgi:hypothetical protein